MEAEPPKDHRDEVIVDMPDETVHDIEEGQYDEEGYYSDDGSQAVEVGDVDEDEEHAMLLEMAQNDPEVNQLLQMAAKPATPRPPSNVPIASKAGMPPAPQQPPRPYVVIAPEPTRTQIAQETARNIGRVAAENASRRMQQDNYTALRAQKQFQKNVETDPAIIEEKIKLIALILRYKKHYEGKIKHKFKREYNPDTSTVPKLEQEKKDIQDELNGALIPEAIKDVIKGFGNVLVLSAHSFGSDMFDGLDEKVNLAVDAGEFDPEVTQIGCEMAEYFMMGAKQRALYKFANKGIETVRTNRPDIVNAMMNGQVGQPHPNAPRRQARPGIDPNMVQRNRDL